MIKNLVIFGGSFNPVHNGHLNMALETQSFLGGPDDCKIVFVPNKNSVWKKDDVQGVHKYEMIKRSIKNYVNLDLDDFELNNTQENYSYLTIEYFLNKYKNMDIKLYFLIGSDQVQLFHKWKNAEDISRKVQFLYFPRPNEYLTNDNIDKYNIIRVDSNKMVEVSSSDVRNLLNLNIPQGALEYINENNLYFLDKVKSYVDEKRFNHMKSVGLWSKKVADSNKVADSWKYYVAGLLHDVGKNVPDAECIKIEEEFKDYLPIDKRLYHQFYSATIAEKDFGITDFEILDAIKYHATGKKNMCKMGKVVYAIDKTDPLRGYDSSSMIDALMKDIDSGFVYVLSENKKHLLSKGRDINNKLTCECFSSYLENTK